MAKTASLTGCAVAAGVLLNLTIEAHADTIVLPTFDVVATTPLGGEIDVARYPGAVWQTGAQDIQTFNDTTVTDTLARQAPGVTVGNVSGNDFQPDISYRGFDATPVTGTPIGLAVYQNGVRINEAFGDTVNWDLIPENAIDKMTIVAGNPDLRPQRPRRRPQRHDEERLHMARASKPIFAAARSTARRRRFSTANRSATGRSIWRARRSTTAAGVSDSASQLTNFYGDLGYRANGFEFAPATHRGEHPVRRGGLHADPGAAEQLEQHLHRSADDRQQDGHARVDGQLRLLEHAEFPGRRLFPCVQSGPCRRQLD